VGLQLVFHACLAHFPTHMNIRPDITELYCIGCLKKTSNGCKTYSYTKRERHCIQRHQERLQYLYIHAQDNFWQWTDLIQHSEELYIVSKAKAKNIEIRLFLQQNLHKNQNCKHDSKMWIFNKVIHLKIIIRKNILPRKISSAKIDRLDS